jgi:murein DD-endopeptidase MepM/ murein hydrolase activator NlpD
LKAWAKGQLRNISMKTNRLYLLVVGLVGMISSPFAAELSLMGQLTQGGLVVGQAPNALSVSLDDQPLAVSTQGKFVFGFGRDDQLSHRLVVTIQTGEQIVHTLTPTPRNYHIQSINGIPKKIMQPSPQAVARSQQDNQQIAEARHVASALPYFAESFTAPSQGEITGVYGSQRIFNGEKKRPHFGLDFAGAIGDPVLAPASGKVTLFVPDMFYSGGTLMIDHGQGLNSTFLHLSKAYVKVGDMVKQGQLIAAVGASGRVTGPHLDWRVNWFNVRLDPALILQGPQPLF